MKKIYEFIIKYNKRPRLKIFPRAPKFVEPTLGLEGGRRRGNKRKEGERSRENEDGVTCVDRWGTYGHITNILLANFTKMPSQQNTSIYLKKNLGCYNLQLLLGQ